MPYRTPDDPRKKRRLPTLERLTVHTPCNVSWDSMVGNDRVRHCCQCNRNVYDLTAMFADEAEAFLDEHLGTTGTLPCARLYRRPDGRVMTSQCSTGIDRAHRRRAVAAIAGAAAIAATATHVAVMHVPAMADDDPLVVEREHVDAAGPFVEPAVLIGLLTDDDDDGFEVTQEPAPPRPDVLIRGTIALRGHKSPLERIARAPKRSP